MEQIILKLTNLLLLFDNQVLTVLNWIIDRSAEERYTIALAGAACIWIFHTVIQKIKASQSRKSRIAMATSKKTISDRRKMLLERKFTPDGYYWDPEKQKWIEPDFKQTPSDYLSGKSPNSYKDDSCKENDSNATK